MAEATPSSTWEPATGSLQGMDIRQYNMNCTTGHKIAVDIGQKFTTLGQMFFDRWRNCNKTSIVKFTKDNIMTTNIQIGCRFYPAMIILVNGISPLTIGKDFFTLYNWQEPTNLEIKTELGPVCLKKEGGTLWIDKELSAQAIQCEEVFIAVQSTDKQIRKLHDYFGHVSAENLIRILKASSRRDEFKPKAIKKICKDRWVCKMTTRIVNRKKTAMPKAMGFNQVVSIDLKFHEDSIYVCGQSTKLQN